MGIGPEMVLSYSAQEFNVVSGRVPACQLLRRVGAALAPHADDDSIRATGQKTPLVNQEECR